MASIYQLTNKDGTKVWRAVIRIKNYPTVSDHFDRKKAAENWAKETETEIKKGKYDITKNREKTVAELIDLYPPDGKVRVAAPLAVNDEAIRYAVIGKMGWIKQQQEKFINQPRQSPREMVSGESHYYLGQRYRLAIIESTGPIQVIRNKSVIELHMSPRSNTEQRELALLQWYRKEIKSLIPPMLEKWQPILNVEVAEWGVKKMKTKWGSVTQTSAGSG